MTEKNADYSYTDQPVVLGGKTLDLEQVMQSGETLHVEVKG